MGAHIEMSTNCKKCDIISHIRHVKVVDTGFRKGGQGFWSLLVLPCKTCHIRGHVNYASFFPLLMKFGPRGETWSQACPDVCVEK